MERIYKTFQTPYIGTWIAGFLVGIPAGLWDIATFAELTNIGTLFAFIIVSASVIVLRKKQPDRPRTFRVPLVPVVPILSILCCLLLMMGLPLLTWIRFFLWLIIGLVIYFLYGRKRTACSSSDVSTLIVQLPTQLLFQSSHKPFNDDQIGPSFRRLTSRISTVRKTPGYFLGKEIDCSSTGGVGSTRAMPW